MDKENASPSGPRALSARRSTPNTRSRPTTPRTAQVMDVDPPNHALESPQDGAAIDAAMGQPLSASSPDQGGERPLNVSDALSYLDSVKAQFSEQPEVYNKFLDIMKDFKSQLIDTPGVIERVSNLFHGHPALIQGFNTFLPSGYRIETSDNPDPNYITVTTPAGTTTQATNTAFEYSTGTSKMNAEERSTLERPYNISQVVSQETLKPALEFMAKIRNSYGTQAPKVYGTFLAILMEMADSSTQLNAADVRQVESWSVACLSAKWTQEPDIIRRIMDLFDDNVELMRDFVEFLPDDQVRQEELARIAELEKSRKASEGRSKRGGDGHPSGSTAVPQKRKRKPVEREKEKEPPPTKAVNKKVKAQSTSQAPSPALTQRQPAGPPSPSRPPPQLPPSAYHPHGQQPLHTAPPIQPPIPPASSSHYSNDFFDRVKAYLDPNTYNEFLKLINLFTQDIINSTRLVREARYFLGDSEYLLMLKDILGWDANKDRMAVQEESWTRPMGVLDRPNRNQLHTRYGSYRKLPPHEVNVPCAGRDEMCNSVLNDEWISQPTFASEDAGFLAHKKNMYEEALHRSEEERHEYDFHIEAIHRTIQVLEPLQNKIAQMPPEERNSFKLKSNLGGVGKAIHQRVIKKIYGREIGNDVWIAMQEVPATAIPVVLVRLKQKHEEWKRAQREWDKVWREVDVRNYHKSLDHQAVTFKAADKKAITQKAFVTQIEAARDEQRATRAALVDPLLARTRPRHQLEFVLDDAAVLQDTLKLMLSFLDRTQGQISLPDRKKIETFLRAFVPLFFMFDPTTFNAALAFHETIDGEQDGEAAGEDVEMASANGSTGSSRSRGNKKGGGGGGDLRKRLLKSEQAKSSRRTRAQEASSPTPSRFASPAPSDAMQVDGEGMNGILRIEKASSRRKGTFYTNTAFYVLLRLLEMLYSRLQLFKNITKEKSDRANDPFEPNPASIKNGIQAELGKISERLNLDTTPHYYELMLESCEKLFDNEMEQNVFEEMLRYMFGLKHSYKLFTVDKLIGALIKQVQVILSDPKSQDLYELLRREREITTISTQDLINCRRNTERVLGPDENLFRVDWLSDSRTMTIQLIGKDDDKHDDTEAMTERWQAYIESFVSHHYTAGVPTSSTIRRPFLLRTKVPAPTGAMPDILARGGLQIKVCVRTYRLFFVSDSEDVMVRLSSRKERAEARRLVEARAQKRRDWLEDYARTALQDEAPESASFEVAPKPFVAPAPEPVLANEAVPEVSVMDAAQAVVDVVMEAKDREAAPGPEVTVHTVPKDDAIAVAVAVATAAPAPECDPADVLMEDAAPTAVAVPEHASSHTASPPSQAPALAGPHSTSATDSGRMQAEPARASSTEATVPKALATTPSELQMQTPPPTETAPDADTTQPTLAPTSLSPPPEAHIKTNTLPLAAPISAPEPLTAPESIHVLAPAPVPVPESLSTLPEAPTPAPAPISDTQAASGTSALPPAPPTS